MKVFPFEIPSFFKYLCEHLARKKEPVTITGGISGFSLRSNPNHGAPKLNFNKNNPTLGWTEDQQYDFCKMENKWLKELTRSKFGKRTA